MKLKSKLMIFTAALALQAGIAQAAITANDVVRSYQAAAYTYIEVADGPTQIKVEAIKGSVKVEVVYDKVSGDVVKQESEAVSGKEAAQAGVEIKSTDKDFERKAGGASDDDSDDDNGSGAGDDSGHDSGDDMNDDHGGSGSDDDSHDNSGKGNSGSGHAKSGHDDSHDDQDGSDD